jgi:hypothetical protein
MTTSLVIAGSAGFALCMLCVSVLHRLEAAPTITREPTQAPAVVVVIVDRAPACVRLDVSDELLSYPPADDEPPQRPWQELRAMGPQQ